MYTRALQEVVDGLKYMGIQYTLYTVPTRKRTLEKLQAMRL